MRQCTRCGKEKPVDDFYKTIKRKDGVHPWCKECCRQDAKKFYKRNPDPYRKRASACRKQRQQKLLAEADRIKQEVGCKACGEKRLCVLDFHHLVGNSKGKNEGMPVSRAACQSNKRFREELAKCVVVCANCHRKVHADELTLI